MPPAAKALPHADARRWFRVFRVKPHASLCSGVARSRPTATPGSRGAAVARVSRCRRSREASWDGRHTVGPPFHVKRGISLCGPCVSVAAMPRSLIARSTRPGCRASLRCDRPGVPSSAQLHGDRTECPREVRISPHLHLPVSPRSHRIITRRGARASPSMPMLAKGPLRADAGRPVGTRRSTRFAECARSSMERQRRSPSYARSARRGEPGSSPVRH